MTAKRCHILFLALLMILIIRAKAYAGRSDTVATVGGGYAITFGELQSFVNGNYYNLAYKDKPFGYAYKKALDQMIAGQLKRIDFFKRGLEKDETLVGSIKRTINEAMVAQYFDRSFFEKYVNERSIRDAYREMKEKVVFRRFLAVVPAGDSAETVDSVNAVGTRLQSALNHGRGFEALASDCRRWFAMAETREDTGTVEWKQTLSSPTEAMIFNLPIGKVEVLKRATALEIVEVIKRETVRVEPFEKARGEIFDLLRGKYMNKSFNDFEKAKKRLVNQDSCVWNQKALAQLITWSEAKGFYNNKLYVDTLKKAISAGRNFVILKYPGGKVDVKDFLRLLNDVLILSQRTSYKVSDLKNFLLDAVRTDKIVRKATALHLQRDILTPKTTDAQLENALLMLYDRRVIDQRIPRLTEEAARKFYEANKNTLYYQPTIVIIDAIISSDKNSIDALWRKYSLGTPFDKLVHSWYVKSFARYHSEDSIRSYLSNEPPFLGKLAFSLKLNEVRGPVKYHDPKRGEQYAIVKCIQRTPQIQLTLNEARKNIPTDFRRYEWDKINQETIASLKHKYGFKIYEHVLTRDLSSAR